MIKLLDKANVDPVSPDYPYGSLRNNPGDNTGTPVNKVMVDDVMQLMEKIMAESGITPNGLPDNEANGWQLFEALSVITGGLTKIIPIGTWNMDTTDNVTIAHGITDYTKIRSVDVVIISTLGSFRYPLMQTDGGAYQIDVTDIVLSRAVGGIFDSTSFNGTIDRGYITIKYLP